MMPGKPVVDEILEGCKTGPEDTGLSIVQVGHLPESDSYVAQVEKTAKRVPNLYFQYDAVSEDASLRTLQDVLFSLNEDEGIHGYMLQMPLPPHLQEKFNMIREWINPRKDVDVLGYHTRGVLLSGKRPNQIVPPKPYAVMKILKHYKVDLRGKIVTVVGDGLVGGLLKIMLGNDSATQIICNEHTQNLAELTSIADVVVGASGVPNIIHGDMIKEGAVVVNVGMKEAADGTMQGDVHVDSVTEKASLVTPIRGGLGPVTVAALIQNTFRARVTPDIP